MIIVIVQYANTMIFLLLYHENVIPLQPDV